MTSRRRRALKLEVPWSREPLKVDYARVTSGYHTVVRKVISSGGPQHVRRVGSGDDADVHVQNFFGVNNRVPDVSRYHIDNDRRPVRHFDIPESRLPIQPQPGNSIVLLLESPSVGEYQFGNINFPIAPANDTTGENIHRCLNKVLSDIKQEFINAGLNEATLIENGVIEAKLIEPSGHVIISNPIQFQTNLRTIHGQSTSQKRGSSKWITLRNNVWKALWNEGVGENRLGYIQLCFRARLNTYNPSLIINACTGDLQDFVTNFARTELPKVPLYKFHHPADTSWRDCGDMGLGRIYPPDNSNAGIP